MRGMDNASDEKKKRKKKKKKKKRDDGKEESSQTSSPSLFSSSFQNSGGPLRLFLIFHLFPPTESLISHIPSQLFCCVVHVCLSGSATFAFMSFLRGVADPQSQEWGAILFNFCASLV